MGGANYYLINMHHRIGFYLAIFGAFHASSGNAIAQSMLYPERIGIIQEISEGLNHDVWTLNRDGSESVVETVSHAEHPVRAGNYSIRAHLGKGAEHYRAEFNARRVLPENEYWYGWSLYFSPDLPIDEEHWGTIPTQFKIWPRTGIGEKSLPGGGVGTHLWLANKRVGDRLGHPGVPLLKLVHHWESLESDPYGEREIQVGRFVVKVNPKLGVWHDFVMHVKWSETGKGFLKLWHQENGSGYSLAVDRTGPTMWRNQPKDQGPFFAAGPYAHGSTAARTIYIDEFRLGDISSSFQDVRPDPNGAPLSPQR